jgi:hypothetical protein
MKELNGHIWSDNSNPLYYIERVGEWYDKYFGELYEYVSSRKSKRVFFPKDGVEKFCVSYDKNEDEYIEFIPSCISVVDSGIRTLRISYGSNLECLIHDYRDSEWFNGSYDEVVYTSYCAYYIRKKMGMNESDCKVPMIDFCGICQKAEGKISYMMERLGKRSIPIHGMSLFKARNRFIRGKGKCDCDDCAYFDRIFSNCIGYSELLGEFRNFDESDMSVYNKIKERKIGIRLKFKMYRTDGNEIKGIDYGFSPRYHFAFFPYIYMVLSYECIYGKNPICLMTNDEFILKYGRIKCDGGENCI